MKRSVSVGYLRPRVGAIEAATWTLLEGRSSDLDLPPAIEAWDYHQDVRIALALDVDLPTVLSDCQLPDYTELRTYVQWHSTATGLRGSSPLMRLHHGRMNVPFTIPGELLGGTLNLEARVSLGRLSAEHVSPFAPKRIGALLWSAQRSVRLEGVGSRFPLTQLSFANSGIAGGRAASWCLLFESTDLDDSAAGSLRLFLNTDLDQVRQHVSQPEAPSAVQFMRNLRFSVQRQLVAFACEHGEFDIERDWDSGSLGEMLSTLVSQLFPDRELESLRADLRSNPGEFEAELQARTGYIP